MGQPPECRGAFSSSNVNSHLDKCSRHAAEEPSRSRVSGGGMVRQSQILSRLGKEATDSRDGIEPSDQLLTKRKENTVKEARQYQTMKLFSGLDCLVASNKSGRAFWFSDRRGLTKTSYSYESIGISGCRWNELLSILPLFQAHIPLPFWMKKVDKLLQFAFLLFSIHSVSLFSLFISLSTPFTIKLASWSSSLATAPAIVTSNPLTTIYQAKSLKNKS